MRPSSSDSRSAIAIVGAGIIGLSIAWRLARARFKVSLFDQGKAGGEASWAGAGMLAPGGEIDESDELATLAVESRRMYTDFVSELEECCGLSIDFQPCGALDVAYSQSEMEALDARAERQALLGIQSKRISTSHVTAFWPRVRREGLTGARFYPKDAVVNPRELTHALKQVCGRRQYIEITEYCRVVALHIASDGVRVEHEHGSAKCDVAIVAAGAWSGAIELSGAPPLPKTEPVKGQLIGYQQPEQTCNTIVRHGHTYLLQRANGLLIAGSSMERVGFDPEVNPFIESEIESRAGYVMPHLAETTKSESWMGFRPASDKLHIGWHSPRLLLAYGHFRNGILLAPVTAERIFNEVNANWQTP
ncbi:MAG TPA: glycine oxidase ThiO [Bryobacteraceae bacterium]|nr:glycine oxidase ThiO [Bryobacteraceae bacterium]